MPPVCGRAGGFRTRRTEASTVSDMLRTISPPRFRETFLDLINYFPIDFGTPPFRVRKGLDFQRPGECEATQAPLQIQNSRVLANHLFSRPLSPFHEDRSSPQSSQSEQPNPSDAYPHFFRGKIGANALLWIGLSPIQSNFSQRLCELCERLESSNWLRTNGQKILIRAQSLLLHLLALHHPKITVPFDSEALGQQPVQTLLY
jgi:hypothetical protein